MAKELELQPSEVTIDPAISKGPVDKETVAEIMETYVNRREENQRHQINAGTVRLRDNQHVLITGRHRLIACLELNKQLGKGEEPYLFHAFVVKDTDLQALESQITENEKRRKVTVFERGESMQALLDLGRTQDQVAALYGMDKSTVSSTLACNRLPAKLKKAVMAGDMEQDAALLAATCEDKTVMSEIVEHALANRQFYIDMESRLANGAGDAEKTEETEETEPAKKKAKKKAAPPKVSKEDIARAAKQHPAAKSAAKKAASTSGALSRKQATAHMEALRKDKEKPLPKSAVSLLSRFEAFLDGELSPQALYNSLVKNCTAD